MPAINSRGIVAIAISLWPFVTTIEVTMSKRDTRQLSSPPNRSNQREVIEVAAEVFQNSCLQLLDQVRDRSLEVIVTKRGEPVARVVPAGGSLPSAFGFIRGPVAGRGDIVAADHEAWDDLT